MQLPSGFGEMLRSSETIYVDFKEQLPDDLRDHLMGFANRYGVHILIGVKEIDNPDGSQSGQAVGFEIPSVDQFKQKIDNLAHSLRPWCDS